MSDLIGEACGRIPVLLASQGFWEWNAQCALTWFNSTNIHTVLCMRRVTLFAREARQQANVSCFDSPIRRNVI